MADVKIINIDNEQWNIKDQMAREKIANLETEMEKLKTIEKWEYTVPIYGGQVTARRQGNVVSISAENIGRVTSIASTTGDVNIAILPERFRPSEAQFFMMKTSKSYLTNFGGKVYPAGNINIWTYEEISNGDFSLSYIVN